MLRERPGEAERGRRQRWRKQMKERRQSDRMKNMRQTGAGMAEEVAHFHRSLSQRLGEVLYGNYF